MQIIQGIRDKGAAIVIVVISLSLIGFILMDAKQGGNYKTGSGSVGKVNGHAIEYTEFNKKVKNLELQSEQQSGQKTTNARSAEFREQVWNQVVAEEVFYAEASKLGIEFTSKELDALLKSSDQSNPLMQERSMLDPATGKLDMSKVGPALANIKKLKGEQWDAFNSQIIEPQKLTSISTKYFALLNASAYYPAWMEEKDLKESKSFAVISYVQVPYQTISDSTIKVTDAEVEKYVKEHEHQFKQEAGRMISYVAFSQQPSADDSARTRAEIEKLKNSFATETNVKNFIARNASAIPYDSTYRPKTRIQTAQFDSILKVPQNTVYGPYVENGSYVLARILGSRPVADSIRARHILFKVNDPETGQSIMEEGQAKKMADSVLALIKAGGDFAALAKQYGSDGTKDIGGDLGYFGYQAPMVPEFNQATFGKPVGTQEVIFTRFGYHVIEITGEKALNPGYQIAFLAKEIFASEATINKASNDAVKLSGIKDLKKFDEYIQKNGLIKTTAPALVKENDAQIGQQLTDARALVRWVYEAKKGDISDPMAVGNQFVVAVVDKVYKEGIQDVETARPMAEKSIRELKKAEMIIKNLGANPTLETAAAKYAKEVLTAGADSSITFKSQIINGIGNEPKLIGAIFNKANLNKVAAPVAGTAGVYVFRVNSISEKATDPNEDKTQLRMQQTTALRNQAVSNWFEGLKKKATIKDNRSEYF